MEGATLCYPLRPESHRSSGWGDSKPPPHDALHLDLKVISYFDNVNVESGRSFAGVASSLRYRKPTRMRDRVLGRVFCMRGGHRLDVPR